MNFLCAYAESNPMKTTYVITILFVLSFFLIGCADEAPIDSPDAGEVDGGHVPGADELFYVPAADVRRNPLGGTIANSPCNGFLFLDTSKEAICVSVALTARATTAGIYAWNMDSSGATEVGHVTADFGIVEETHIIDIEFPKSERLSVMSVPLNPGWGIGEVNVHSCD